MSAWAHVEHGLGMHVYTPAQRDAPTNMINNALCVGAVHKLRFAQDIILYNLEVSEQIEGFDGSAHKDVVAERPDLAGRARERREADRHPRLGAGVLRDGGRLRAARRRAVPQRVRHAGRGAAGRLRHAGDHGLRRGRHAPASSAARARCSGCSPTTSSTAPPTSELMQSWLDEWIPVSLAGRAAAAADLVADLREGRALRRLAGRARSRAWPTCWKTSRSRSPRRSAHDRVPLRPHVVQPGRRDAHEQPGRLRRRPGDGRTRRTSRSASCRR